MTPRRVAVLSGCRSDYGLLRPLLAELDSAEDCELLVYAVAGHLSTSRGGTVGLIEADGYRHQRLGSLDEGSPDDPCSMAELAGRLCRELALRWRGERPDILVALGDRVEVLGAATAAWYSRVALAQLQAGDLSRVDDGPRHAVSRLAHLLFPATVEAERRLLAWGEEPRRVHRVGSLALDHALGQPPLAGEELVELGHRLGLPLTEPFLLLLYHPLPGEEALSRRGLEACLSAIATAALPCLALYPNADAGGREIIHRLEEWAVGEGRALTANLPPREFVGLLRRCACLVGNSSAGLIECSALGTPAVNVGPRQTGRERGANVLDAESDAESDAGSVGAALAQVLAEPDLRRRLEDAPSPYGDSAAAGRIRRILTEVVLDEDFLSKTLHTPGQ